MQQCRGWRPLHPPQEGKHTKQYLQNNKMYFTIVGDDAHGVPQKQMKISVEQIKYILHLRVTLLQKE